jgi:hypothetical protein
MSTRSFTPTEITQAVTRNNAEIQHHAAPLTDRGWSASQDVERHLSGSVSLSQTYCPIIIHPTCRCGHYEPEERRLPRQVLLQFRKRRRGR